MTQYIGVVDNRSKEQKLQDFSLSEIKTLGVYDFFEERDPVHYTVRNQDGSGSCVAQTVAKMLEIWDLKHDNTPTIYSATPIYQSRTNKPSAGMNYIDAFSHPIKKGTFLENEIPSQLMNDAQMDSEVLDGTAQSIKPTNYLTVPIEFYSVAEEVRTKGAVMLWFKCSYTEWCRDVPEGLSNSEEVRHSVCAVDAIEHNGEEYLIIEDSWGEWLNTSTVPLNAGQRAITKTFFDKHCFFAGVFTTFIYDGGTRPKYNFVAPLKFGDKSPSVQMLQLMLKYEKFFPSNVETTLYFGAITARALKAWQVKHGILDFATETNMTKIRFGEKSIKLANSLYK